MTGATLGRLCRRDFEKIPRTFWDLRLEWDSPIDEDTDVEIVGDGSRDLSASYTAYTVSRKASKEVGKHSRHHRVYMLNNTRESYYFAIKFKNKLIALFNVLKTNTLIYIM